MMKNDVIGANCTLRPGVVFRKKLTEATGGAVVGDNVIVGANSVITKDMPSDCVIAGALAKVLKSLK